MVDPSRRPSAAVERLTTSGVMALASARCALDADAGHGLDWLVTSATAWLLGGLYADGWAHGYGLPDNFWTIWHAIFYSGFAAMAAVLCGAVALRRPRAASWSAAIPRGYLASFVGVIVFAVGGAFDAGWHAVFGVEVGNDALLSPSHLLLGLGIALLVTGPLRADLLRDDRSRRLARRLPMVLSLTALFSLFTFFTLFSGPYSGLLGGRGSNLRGDTVFRGLLGMYVFSALVAGFLLVALRRTTLPVGAVTVFLAVNGVAMILMQGHAPFAVQLAFSGVAIAAGVAGDLFLAVLMPSTRRPVALRAFAALVPAAFFVLYFAVVRLVAGGWAWTFTFVSGAVVGCAVIGLLLSYLVVPPVATPGASASRG